MSSSWNHFQLWSREEQLWLAVSPLLPKTQSHLSVLRVLLGLFEAVMGSLICELQAPRLLLPCNVIRLTERCRSRDKVWLIVVETLLLSFQILDLGNGGA